MGNKLSRGNKETKTIPTKDETPNKSPVKRSQPIEQDVQTPIEQPAEEMPWQTPLEKFNSRPSIHQTPVEEYKMRVFALPGKSNRLDDKMIFCLNPCDK